MLVERYQIVPKGDGYHYLCVDTDSGGYVLQHKAEDLPIGLMALQFKTKSMAERYIAKYLLVPEEYEAEAFLINEKEV